MEYKRLRPAQILLDPENPRLPDGTSSDKEAINRLLEEGYDQMIALARDLVDQGESNPSELPIVLKQGRKYLVLEGNRRFAVLKLLADPLLADDTAHQSAFKREAAKGKAPTHVYSAIADNREQADHWIMLRHTGANNGVSVKRWSADQTATHRRRMRAPVDSGTVRAIAIADELTEAYQTDLELVAAIQRVRASKLTNIGRFFASDVLLRIQLEIQQVAGSDSRTLWARHTAEQLREFFTWAIAYIEDNSVDAYKNDTIRAKLLNDNGDLIPEPSAALPASRRLADYQYVTPAGTSSEEAESDAADQSAGAGDSGSTDSGQSRDGGSTGTGDGGGGGSDGNGQGSGASDSTGAGGRGRDQTPEKALYSKVKLNNLPPPVQRLLREAKAMQVEDSYAIACVLSRVILELVVSSEKVLAWSGASESDKLAQKIKACIFKLDPAINNPVQRTRGDLEQAFQETDGMGVRYMHQFIHNSMVNADPHLARRFSGAFTPLLNSINQAVAN